MKKGRLKTSPSSVERGPSARAIGRPHDVAGLRRRLEELETELTFYRSKHQWLVSALATQRHARQMLEASVSASYSETISRIREVVNNLLPPNATLIVISKGDEELLRFDMRSAWHFPQNEQGVYAGHYPTDSAEAISQLRSLIRRGGEFLLIPNTAFWWLEHYRELKEWLELSHSLAWRDECCAIYSLSEAVPIPVRRSETIALSSMTAAEAGTNIVRLAKPNPARRRSDIVCFPIIDWDFRFQRPQQLMRRLASAGHRVFYLTHQFRKTGQPYSLRPIAPCLREVSLRGPRYAAYEGVLDGGYCEALLGTLSQLWFDQSIETAIAVVQSPFWWPLAKEAARVFHWRLVYDCMDLHAGFSTVNPMLIEQERELLTEADLVITSSGLLAQEARRFAQNVLTIRNGCDYGHFARLNARPRRKRPVIGYYGAIAEWFDSDLLADLARRRPDWDFLLIGSTFRGDVRRLSKLPNVSLPGEKPYSQIPTWLAKFDVAILPFKRTPLTEAANPVKAYEILASGKPLVSVPLPELLPLKPLVRLASTVDEFEREILEELKPNRTDRTLQRRRRAFARQNTWDVRFRQLSSALVGLLQTPDSKTPALTGRLQRLPALYE